MWSRLQTGRVSRRRHRRRPAGGSTQHRTEPHRTAPECTGAHRSAPERTASHRAAYARVWSTNGCAAGAGRPICVMYQQLSERYFHSKTKCDYLKFTADRSHRNRTHVGRHLANVIAITHRNSSRHKFQIIVFGVEWKYRSESLYITQIGHSAPAM